MREREGLISRIRQIRRVAIAPEKRAAATETEPDAARFEGLEARLTHVEHMVQGLQDSVHREVERHGKLIADLQAQTQPGAISAALSKDARDRGL